MKKSTKRTASEIDDADTATAGTSSSEKAPVAAKRSRTSSEKEPDAAASSAFTFENFETQLHPSWAAHVGEEFKKPYFKSLREFLLSEAKAKQQIFPPVEKVFSCFNECPWDNVRVVIFGQDPYHDDGQAHGMCFSVQKGVKIPPSLVNIYKELATDIPGFKAPSHGYLGSWASQGVLLLNATMTVRAHNANSHAKKGWEKFTDAVVAKINAEKSGVVFLLWGKPAQDKGARIDKKKHHVLTSVHPSPLSASRGWFGSKHFSKCNELLVAQGLSPIDWNLH